MKFVLEMDSIGNIFLNEEHIKMEMKVVVCKLEIDSAGNEAVTLRATHDDITYSYIHFAFKEKAPFGLKDELTLTLTRPTNQNTEQENR